jgi:hypothetical protein
MRRKSLGVLAFLAVVGVGDLLAMTAREAKAQLVAVPVDTAVWPAGYYRVKVRGRGKVVTVRERGFAAPVRTLVPTVAAVPTTTVVAAPALTSQVVTTAATMPVVERRFVTTAATPVIERRFVAAAPVVRRRVVPAVPVIGVPGTTTYIYPY